MGRSFLWSEKTLPFLTNLNNSLILLFLHKFDFTHFRHNKCQNTANQYRCQGRYWPFLISFLEMILIEDCRSRIYRLVSTFLDFHGKVALVYTLTNPFDFPMIFIWNLTFSYTRYTYR